jgi:alkyl hydroperoxide reductase subunit F
MNQEKEIIVDIDCRTSVPGIFAAGDITNVRTKQIITAAGEGAKAALSAYDYLIK